MFLRRGIRNNKDPSTMYEVTDVETFFRRWGERVNAHSVETAEKLSPVAAAHRIYTDTIASMPFIIRQKRGEERIEVDHYLSMLLKLRANDYMTAFMVKKIQLSQAFWYGTGYIYIKRGRDGRVTELIPLPSRGAQRYFDEKTGMMWYSFTADADMPERKRLERKFAESELLIFRFESYDGYNGRGLLDLAAPSIRVDTLAQRYNEKFYSNGARISGIVETAANLNQESREMLRTEFENMASGLDNAFRVAVLDNGLKYTPMGLSQKEAEYIESRQFTVSEIARFTGIPEYMLQEGKQSYSSNEQQQLDFITNRLAAPIAQYEQEWSYKLFTQEELDSGMYLKLNEMVRLRGDDKARGEFYQKMISLGVMSQDEVRALEDRSPLPDGLGKRYWMSRNYNLIERFIDGTEQSGG